MMYGYNGWGWGGMMGGYGVFGDLMMVVFWVAVAAVVLFIVRSHGMRGGSSARDILEERYARGEMSREEFEQKKKDLA